MTKILTTYNKYCTWKEQKSQAFLHLNLKRWRKSSCLLQFNFTSSTYMFQTGKDRILKSVFTIILLWNQCTCFPVRHRGVINNSNNDRNKIFHNNHLWCQHLHPFPLKPQHLGSWVLGIMCSHFVVLYIDKR